MKRYGYLIGTICWICAIGLFVAAIASGMTTSPTPIQTYIFVRFGIILFIIGIIIIFPVTSFTQKKGQVFEDKHDKCPYSESSNITRAVWALWLFSSRFNFKNSA